MTAVVETKRAFDGWIRVLFRVEVPFTSPTTSLKTRDALKELLESGKEYIGDLSQSGMSSSKSREKSSYPLIRDTHVVLLTVVEVVKFSINGKRRDK